MKIVDYSSLSKTKTRKRHSKMPNTPARILLCGSTGCGKTNLLLNFVYDLLPWEKLYIFARDLQESKYLQLQEEVSVAEEYSREQIGHFANQLDIDVDELDPSHHNLVVFDDFVTADCKTMQTITDYFIRGRKKNATVIFISQSYYTVPKDIRLQCSYLIFFHQPDDRHLGEIHRNHGCGIKRQDFVDCFQRATQGHDFFCIDQTAGSVFINFEKI